MVQRYPALVDGAFVIIAWVGIKLLIEYAPSLGWIWLRDPEMAVARPDRRDLRGVLLLCAKQGPPAEADVTDDDANELINDQIK